MGQNCDIEGELSRVWKSVREKGSQDEKEGEVEVWHGITVKDSGIMPVGVIE